MRIAHVITRMIVGGAQENTLYNCLDLMHDFGDEVLLITGPTLGPEGRLLEQGRASGLRVETIESLQRPIHPRDWTAYRALKNVLRDFGPEVVHTHSAKGGMLGRAAAWKLFRQQRKQIASSAPSTHRLSAVIHTVHGAPFHPYQNFLARWLFIACERWAAKRCHHFISVADAMTALMVEAQVAKRDRFTTIYSGMSVKPFLYGQVHRDEMRRELGIADGEIVVGKIARLFHLKGHEYLIEAAEQLRSSSLPIKYLLVGDGILRKQWEDKIQKAGLTDRFIFTGLVTPEDIPKHLSAMDILVHTSLREGLARTLPQALLSGIPAVSYDVDGAREVVLDSQTGFLLPPKSIKPLATAIQSLAANAELRQRMGQRGKILCREKFDHHFMTARIREVYQRILAKNNPANS